MRNRRPAARHERSYNSATAAVISDLAAPASSAVSGNPIHRYGD
jgi:hypothetical protein